MKRKIISSIIAIGAAVLLTACGSSVSANEDNDIETTQETTQDTAEVEIEATEVTVNSDGEAESGITIIYGEILEDDSDV